MNTAVDPACDGLDSSIPLEHAKTLQADQCSTTIHGHGQVEEEDEDKTDLDGTYIIYLVVYYSGVGRRRGGLRMLQPPHNRMKREYL